MLDKTTENKDPNRVLKVWTKVSDETGVKVEMVGHIHESIIQKRKESIQINSKNATQYVIQGLINNDNGSVADILSNNGIECSEEIGIVIQSLCKEGVLKQEENDQYEDFNDLFTLETINQFIKKNKLKKEINWYTMFSYALYFIGFIIILASYLSLVSNKIGWSGWGIGMLGWLLMTFRNKIEPFLSKKKSK